MSRTTCAVMVLVMAPLACSRSKPAPIATLEAGRSVLVAFDQRGSRALVIDPAAPRVSQWTALDTQLQRSSVRGAWWRPARRQIFVRLGSTDFDLIALGRDGHAERVLTQRAQDLDAAKVWKGCALSVDATTLVCYGHEAIDGQLPTAYRTGLRVEALAPGTPPRLIRWSAPVAEAGVLALLGDATKLVYADRCPGAASGASCLYRANLAGDARTLVATLPGSACVIEPSLDGRLVAVASQVEGDACSELSVISLDAPERVAVRTSLLPPKDRPMHHRGIGAIAWSPDAARLALSSDHAEGCAGSQGVVTCTDQEYVVDAAKPGFRAVSTFAHEATALVWLPE